MSIVCTSDAPTSSYHSKVKSGYWPLKNEMGSPASERLALTSNSRMAVLKNYTIKIPFFMLRVWLVSVLCPIILIRMIMINRNT